MRYSAIIAGLFAATALAKPIDKRAIIYDVVDVVTVVKYVTAGVPEATPAPVAPVKPAAAPAAAPVKPVVAAAPVKPVVAAAPAKPVVVVAAAPVKPAAAPVQAAPKPVVYTTTPPAAIATIAATAPVQAAPASNMNVALKAYDADLQPGDAGFVSAVLAHHNVHRANHSAADLEYDYDLAKYAQIKAQSCVWNEDAPEGFTGSAGMNIAQGTYTGAANISGVISGLWYNNELGPYASGAGWGNSAPNVAGSGSTFSDWGHLSQVVWKGTQKVACGAAACGAGSSIGSGYFAVCMYSPPGNYLGAFQNVGIPKGDPTVVGASPH